jgi:LysM repeat protein
VEHPFRSEAKKIMGDEVDLVLKQYAQTESPIPVVAAQPEIPSFVGDLKAVTAPEEKPAVLETPYIEIKVKKGDVLEKIARLHHTTVSELMKINHLTSTQLKIGQVLQVPASSGEKKEEEKKTPLDPTSAKYYTVKPGDNPWTIAVKNHMRVEELLKLNNMTEEKARKLKPGDQIRIH